MPNNKIATLSSLQHQLKILDTQLVDSDLACLVTFNKAYEVVTTAIVESVKGRYFENSKFITAFTLCFAQYYLNAINNALVNNDLPVAWSQLLQRKSSKNLPNFIYLLLGANAHINHDLSLVMAKMLDNDDTENLLNDIIKVDKLLVGSGRKILNTFTETKSVPRFIKNRLSYLYLPVVMHIILYWRVKAWKDYLNIKNNGLAPDRSQIKGKAVGHRLLKLGQFLG